MFQSAEQREMRMPSERDKEKRALAAMFGSGCESVRRCVDQALILKIGVMMTMLGPDRAHLTWGQDSFCSKNPMVLRLSIS